MNKDDFKYTVVPGVYVPDDDGNPKMAYEITLNGLVKAEENEIVQQILPSVGTKLVCTKCGREDWHFLMLRKKAGLLEGLCKQVDGSGCYPISSRSNCQYTYPNQMDCIQLAEFAVAEGADKRNVRCACRDHVGEVLRQGASNYLVWPLAD
jgi:hypothetical protein